VQILKPIRGSQLNRSHPLARGLKGCWLMNEGCGGKIFDLSGNGNTLSTAGPTWQPANFGSGLYHNGSNQYSAITPCPDNLKMDDTQAFTAVVWFYCATATEGVLVATDRNTANGGWSFELGPSGKLYTYIQNAGQASDSNLWDAGRWNQFVMVYGAPAVIDIIFYVNGIQVYTKDMTTIVYTAGRPFILGVDPRDLSGNDPVGTFDNVMLYNRVLTASEIALLYRRPFCMFEAVTPKFYVAAAAPAPAGTHQRHIGFRPIEGADRLRDLLRAG